MNAVAQYRLIEIPAVGLFPMKVHEANRLLVKWNHKLGACERPFHSEAFCLEVHGEPIAVAISASIINGPVAGYERDEVVELARQASANRWANRVMIRLWREVCAPAWPCWPVKAAVSYSHNGLHEGHLYRFDGWEKAKDGCGSRGGGTWGRKRKNTDIVYGPKTLWVWRYQEAA